MNPPGTKVRTPSRRKRTLLVIFLAFVLSIALVAWRLTTPPAPFPIPPDLALAYPQAQFDSPDNAWHLYREAQKQLPQHSAVSAAAMKLDLTEVKLPTEFFHPETWTDDEVKAATEWLRTYGPVLRTLERALTKPYYIEKHSDAFTRPGHVFLATHMGMAYLLQAGLHGRSNDHEAAVKDLLTGMRLAVQFTGFGPFTQRQLAVDDEFQAGRILAFCLSSGIVHHPTLLRRVRDAMLELDDRRFPFADTHRVEFRIDLAAFNEEAHTPFFDHQALTFDPDAPSIDWEGASIRLAIRLQSTSLVNSASQAFRDLVRAANSDAPEYLKAAQQADALFDQNHVYWMFNRGFRRSALVEFATIATTRTNALIAALLLYHLDKARFPVSLTELVPSYVGHLPEDPFTKQPLQGRQEGRRFVVWSIGSDLKDDGGRNPIRPAGWAHEPGDLVWRLEPPK